MTYDEKYLYELPDFIFGKTSPELTKEIERLISQNSDFRKEYESMKSIITNVEVPLDEAFAKPAPLYFANFSVRLNDKLRATKIGNWKKIANQVQSLFAEPFQPRLVGGFASFAVIALLILTILKSDLYTITLNNEIVMLQEQDEFNLIESHNDDTELATINYAVGGSFNITDLDDKQSDLFLKKIDDELPLEESDFKVLSKEDIKSLLN